MAYDSLAFLSRIMLPLHSSRITLASLVVIFGLGACASDPTQVSSNPVLPATEGPLPGVRDAFESASELKLPKQEPIEESGLRHVFRLSENIYSGAEPLTEESFESLQALGVKTVVSVDGKIPDADTAGRHGMRYVHVPLLYKGIDEDALARLAKTFRELPTPFYVHCFHGRHRGPAGAAVGRLVLDGASRKAALAEMRQWSGTSSKYAGLYASIATAELPTIEESASLEWDFPSRHPVRAFRSSMADLARCFDNLLLCSEQAWEVSSEHPDLEPTREAQHMAELMQGCSLLDEVRDADAESRERIADSVAASMELVQALEAAKAGSRTRAEEALDRISANCSACHKAHRNN